VKRDPRIQPRRPEIRNFRPDGGELEEDADDDREGPWERLNQPASIRDPGLDVPLAQAMIEAQDGDVLVHETADGAVGLRCVFPALESSTPTRSRG
jgi:hypothetical protein